MKSLLLHANNFAVRIEEASNKPGGIIPENLNSSEENADDCLVAFFCVEMQDGAKTVNDLYIEIVKSADDFGTKNIVIAPFVHLSNNIADPSTAKELYINLVEKFEGSDYQITTSHFGYHKRLLLDVKGHPGSFRFRTF